MKVRRWVHEKVYIFVSGLMLMLCLSMGIVGYKSSPHLTLVYTGGELGGLEPCGCSEEMLGGITRRDTIISSIGEKRYSLLILATGNIVSGASRQDEIIPI